MRTQQEQSPPDEEALNPYPSQAESDEIQTAVIVTAPLGQPAILARDGDDLTPVMTQAQNDMAMLIAAGPAPDSLPPMVKDVPYVSGTATVGGTLTCTMGNWTGQPTDYAYAWSGAGAAMAENYVVDAADAGTEITCTVTATNANGSTTAPPSNAVAIDAGATAEGAPTRRGR